MSNAPRRFSAFALLIAVSALIGAGCGSSTPKISDAAYIDKCVSSAKDNETLQKFSDEKLKALCVCTQKELVAKGMGDKKTDDKSEELQKVGTAVGTKCAAQELTGG